MTTRFEGIIGRTADEIVEAVLPEGEEIPDKAYESIKAYVKAGLAEAIGEIIRDMEAYSE